MNASGPEHYGYLAPHERNSQHPDAATPALPDYYAPPTTPTPPPTAVAEQQESATTPFPAWAALAIMLVVAAVGIGAIFISSSPGTQEAQDAETTAPGYTVYREPATGGAPIPGDGGGEEDDPSDTGSAPSTSKAPDTSASHPAKDAVLGYLHAAADDRYEDACGYVLDPSTNDATVPGSEFMDLCVQNTRDVFGNGTYDAAVAPLDHSSLAVIEQSDGSVIVSLIADDLPDQAIVTQGNSGTWSINADRTFAGS